MDDKKVLGGAAALIAVMLLIVAGMAIQPQEEDLQTVVSDELAPVSESLAALGERLSGLEAELGSLADETAYEDDLGALRTQLELLATQTADTASAADLGALREEIAGIAGMSGEMSDELADIAGMSGALGEEIAALRSGLATGGGTAAAPATSAPVSEPSALAAQKQEVALDPNAEPGMMPGETALFSDGSLRVFLSKLDPAADSVRVSIDGDMQTLAVGEPRMMAAGNGFCEVSLDAVSRIGAHLAARCDDELPPPAGISVGRTAIFDDGAVRVFASMVEPDAARLDVNGELVKLGVGRSVPIALDEKRCRVSVDGIDRNHVQVGMICGDDVNVSDPITPGSAVVLGDGAARVFLSSAMDGAAKFAVNGQTLISGGPGQSVELDGGCSVAVEDIADGEASFSYVCFD